MTSAAVLGVDLGTQSTKATLVALDGRTLATASVPVEVVRRRPGWAEQDPSLLEESTLEAIRGVLERVPGGSEVVALALAGQMGGAIGVDASFAPVTPYESWQDIRSDGDRAAVVADAGRAIRDATGILPFVGPRARRWLRLDPTLGGRIAKVVSPVGYVVGRLSGARAALAICDSTQAPLYGCFDCRVGGWDPALARAVGIPERMLPHVVSPTEIVGRLSSASANCAGLAAGLPIAGGAGDGTAGWLGAGAVEPGVCVDTGGTSDHFAVGLDRFVPDPDDVLTCIPSAVPGLFHLMGFTIGTGMAKRWLADLVASGRFEALERAAGAVEPGAGGILCIPHLNGRATPFEPAVRGAFVGLDEQTTGADLYRALLEGLAFEFVEWIDRARRLAPAVAVKEAIAIGGSARSALAVQVKADVLGVRYVRARPEVNAARGAALLAAAAVEAVELTDPQWRRPELIAADTAEPNERASERYRLLGEAYRSLDEGLVRVNELLVGLRGRT